MGLASPSSSLSQIPLGLWVLQVGSKHLRFPAEENQIKLVAEFLKFKEKTGSYGVYVSSNRPTNNLIEKVKDFGYDLKKGFD